jgi:homoserine O-acetyltransferase
MDSHNIAKERYSISNALGNISANTLVIGISSDQLCPIQEQQELAEYIPKAHFEEIDSIYGHDGFLVEVQKTQALILHYFFG